MSSEINSDERFDDRQNDSSSSFTRTNSTDDTSSSSEDEDKDESMVYFRNDNGNFRSQRESETKVTRTKSTDGKKKNTSNKGGKTTKRGPLTPEEISTFCEKLSGDDGLAFVKTWCKDYFLNCILAKGKKLGKGDRQREVDPNTHSAIMDQFRQQGQLDYRAGGMVDSADELKRIGCCRGAGGSSGTPTNLSNCCCLRRLYGWEQLDYEKKLVMVVTKTSEGEEHKLQERTYLTVDGMTYQSWNSLDTDQKREEWYKCLRECMLGFMKLRDTDSVPWERKIKNLQSCLFAKSRQTGHGILMVDLTYPLLDDGQSDAQPTANHDGDHYICLESFLGILAQIFEMAGETDAEGKKRFFGRKATLKKISLVTDVNSGHKKTIVDIIKNNEGLAAATRQMGSREKRSMILMKYYEVTNNKELGVPEQWAECVKSIKNFPVWYNLAVKVGIDVEKKQMT